MKRNYHTLDNEGRANERRLAEFLSKNGQQLLPMVDLIVQSRMAIDGLVDTVGRATIEAVLRISAEQVAGPPQQGRTRLSDIIWHGTQAGSVYLKERKLKISKPRLRKKGTGAAGEVSVPAYSAMQDRGGMSSRMMEILLEGVSTRRYQGVIPKMADTVGVSKSSVSRAIIQASEAEVEKLRIPVKWATDSGGSGPGVRKSQPQDKDRMTEVAPLGQEEVRVGPHHLVSIISFSSSRFGLHSGEEGRHSGDVGHPGTAAEYQVAAEPVRLCKLRVHSCSSAEALRRM